MAAKNLINGIFYFGMMKMAPRLDLNRVKKSDPNQL